MPGNKLFGSANIAIHKIGSAGDKTHKADIKSSPDTLEVPDYHNNAGDERAQTRDIDNPPTLHNHPDLRVVVDEDSGSIL